jgi:hypothetical protein
MKTWALIVTALILLTGTRICIAEPDAAEAAAFDYGQMPSETYKDQITDYFNQTLKDPYSAHIKMNKPRRAWYQTPPIWGSRTYFGWVVAVKVNAKNSYGAYIGDEPYIFVFHGDKITHISNPDEVGCVHHSGFPPAVTP